MSTLPFWTEPEMAPHALWPQMVSHLQSQHCLSPALVQRVLMEQASATHPNTKQGLLIWPAWQSEQHIGLKVVTLFPDNVVKPSVQGLVLLFDAKDGSPLSILDGTSLTRWKTAADSALGAQLLAPQDAHTLLMVGAGAMAQPLIEAHCSVRPSIQEVLIWNRHAGKAQALAERLSANCNFSTRFKAVTNLQGAVVGAHIICCATGSTKPLVLGKWVQPGTHIDLVGGYTPEMREADDELMRRAQVYVDSRSFTLPFVGDLTQAFASGALAPSDVLGDLFDLCAQRVPARQHKEAITVFKSGGGAHLDLMMAQYFHSQCLQAKG